MQRPVTRSVDCKNIMIMKKKRKIPEFWHTCPRFKQLLDHSFSHPGRAPPHVRSRRIDQLNSRSLLNIAGKIRLADNFAESNVQRGVLLKRIDKYGSYARGWTAKCRWRTALYFIVRHCVANPNKRTPKWFVYEWSFTTSYIFIWRGVCRSTLLARPEFNAVVANASAIRLGSARLRQRETPDDESTVSVGVKHCWSPDEFRQNVVDREACNANSIKFENARPRNYKDGRVVLFLSGDNPADSSRANVNFSSVRVLGEHAGTQSRSERGSPTRDSDSTCYRHAVRFFYRRWATLNDCVIYTREKYYVFLFHSL